MLDIEREFVHPNVDVNALINSNDQIRTLNNMEWMYGIERLNENPELRAACVLWRKFDPNMEESYWLLRGAEGLVIRVYKNNEVTFQRPY